MDQSSTQSLSPSGTGPAEITRAAPSLALVTSRFQLAQADEPAPEAWGEGLMLLLGWRTIVGGLNAYESQTTTMMLGFPEWVVYAAMVPPLFLTGLIGLTQAFVGDFQEQDR